MEPIDERVTAAQLMALRNDPDAPRKIADLLGIAEMPPRLQERTVVELEAFIITGDATAAAQLIHAATVRRSRGTPPVA